ncbi:mechanosensitive ion channel domain-containing protein [Arthrobacter sp. Br18]|uniref:mechanosensitive ion channel family protein n=1 Tax=Arthrobacter sp. Br18 TaxID=1312954 RepID=UPI00047B8B29|nr:mechanosensitive ion channel domain-containing protein [Arthrobacter sp. Br18]
MDDPLAASLPVIAVIAAVVAAVVLAWLIRRVVARGLRNVPDIEGVSRRARTPLRAVLSITAIRMALGATAGDMPWFGPVNYLLVLALIAALAWLAAMLLLLIEAVLLRKYGSETKDRRRMSRLKTQIMLARRVGVAVIITLAAATVLLTIDEVRAVGAGIIASAGLLSVVAGLAVQSSLSNVFAGVQLAFTDAIRVDDVVVVEDKMGTIEEITMTYVVVQVWDERRLILPSTYFTTTPFENWTRRRSELLGTVEMDLDWRAPIDAMRGHLRAVLEGTDLWDGRTATLQVTEAVNGLMRARVLISAADSGAIWDLQCLVREAMVVFLQDGYPDALPRQRWEAVQTAPPAEPDTTDSDGAARRMADARLFSGSPEADRRGRALTGPGEEVFEERKALRNSS